jgi:hypothetical protein
MKKDVATIFGIVVICALFWLAGMIQQQHLTRKELSNYPVDIYDTETNIPVERKPMISPE